MPRMTGGQALVKSLYREGVRVVFGVPGVQLYHAMDALYDEPGIRFISNRHEQGSAYMADGYSRAGGGFGTALVVPGPGLLNASAGVGTAYSASSPMLLVSGQVDRDQIGKDFGALHEVNDQIDAIKTVTKWASRVLEPSDLPDAVHEAFRQMSTGRPRPVEIEVPPDTLAEEADVDLHEPGVYRRQPASDESVRVAAETLAASKSPVIWAGGGAVLSEASEAVVKLAEFLQAPVITTAEGKGVISGRHPLSLGVPNYRPDALDDIVDDADVVLAVGTRMGRWVRLRKDPLIVQVDIDPEEIGRAYDNTLAVNGDARLTLEALHARLNRLGPPRPSRTEETEAARTSRYDPSKHVQPQGSFVEAIRSAMPNDGILIEGVTQIGYYCRTHFQAYEPRTYITSSYFGNLGYAYPTALGAKVAQPDRAVVAVSGDGGFLYNSQELATAVQYGINATVIVFNDNAYGNVKRDQARKFDGRVIGSDLHNPDFVKLAQAYGARGVLAEGPEELEKSLRESLSIEAPTLIEVPVGMMPAPFDD